MREVLLPGSLVPAPGPQGHHGARRALGRLAGGLLAAVAFSSVAFAQTPLENYDAAIATDASGGLSPVAKLSSAVTLTGTGGSAFNFGATSGDGTVEFILEGDPGASDSAYLAVGANTVSSLRYEVWFNTGQLGFTQGGVADYQFTPGVPSPRKASHVAYVWDPASSTMKIYVNGLEAGVCTGVDAAFALPTGQGWLGANESGTEAMVGKIQRVTVYDSALSEAAIRRHSDAFGGQLNQALTGYDSGITADEGAGIVPAAKLTAAVRLTGVDSAPFDFGAVSGSGTIEMILEGDPTLNNSAYLAVGENAASNLRYELWDNTSQLGFTQLGVADYAFAPGVPSPTQPTHIAYAWDAENLTMKMYVNGLLAGTATQVSDIFVLPSGQGLLGNNSTSSEPMAGTIYRITTYDELLSAAVIARHAQKFTDVLRPPIITSFTAAPTSINTGDSATLTWSVQNATTVTINGVDHSGATSLTVSPLASTTYTLTALNTFGNATTSFRLQVVPKLTAYDAAITADAATGLTPVTKLTTPVTLNGTTGSAFDFGATSGDVTIEFIVEGDPSQNVGSYLAVGENPDSSLRYESWGDTTQYGFTQLRVADYLFTPPAPSSTWPTHLAYVWNSTDLVVKIYVNGSLAGSCTGVDPNYVMPSGQGWLGANPTGGEGMVGAIYRVTVYGSDLSDAAIRKHARAFLAAARPPLNDYDVAIETSAAAGLTPLARLYAPVTLTGVGAIPFDFGANADDVTMEFIVEGDPAATVSGFLAVGTNSVSSLRYKVWGSNGALGFTQGGVADYEFTPGITSPTTATHITYAWNAATLTMSGYVNGVLAGTTTGVDPAFGMPQGLAWLGNSGAAGDEPMIGLIHRVTVYDSLESAATIATHASAFTGVVQQPVIAIALRAGTPAVTFTSGVAGKHYRVEYRNSLSAGDAWQVLTDIPSLTGTSGSADDTTAASSRAQRFYRVVLVQ